MTFGNLERKILALVVGFAAKFVTGSLFVFNVYQGVLKDTFNYTQKEVEVISSMASVGLGMGFVPGAMFDRYGPQWTSAAGLVISVSAYLLVWSATRSVAFYIDKSWLMAVYFFLIGFGSIFTYMVALNTNIINFHEKYAVIIVGALNAAFSGSPSIFSVIYYNFFVHGDSTDTANQDFPGFMMMFAICFAATDILCIICMWTEKQPTVADEEQTVSKTLVNENITDAPLSYDAKSATFKTSADSGDNLTKSEAGKYATTETSTGANVLADANPPVKNITIAFSGIDNPVQCPFDREIIESPIENLRNSSFEQNPMNYSSMPDIREEFVPNTYPYSDIPLSLKQLLVNMDYHIFTWNLAFSSSIGLVFVNNVTVISKSLHLDHYDSRLTIIIPTVNGILSLGVGLFSFFCRRSIPKIMIINFGCMCFIVSEVLMLIYAYHIAVLEIATVLVGIASSIVWSIFPAMLLEMFYVGNIGRNWGISILVAGALGFGAQASFGAFYDHAIAPKDETHCYGMRCLRGGTIVTIAFGVVSLVLGVVAQCRRVWLKRQAQNG